MKKQKKISVLVSIFVIIQCLSSLVFVSNSYAAAGNLKVQMYNGNMQSSSNTIYPNFKIYNTSTASINLSNIKLRYYFTSDGIANQSYICDYAGNSSKTITTSTKGQIVSMPKQTSTANNYLEIFFTSTAGTISPNTYIEVKGRITNSTYSNYNQLNDYSFNSSSTTYVDWNNSTGYVSGKLNWGTEPLQKFLIVVAQPLKSGIQAQLSTYVNDLYNDGFESEIITVDKNYSSNPMYACANAKELKGLIRTYYDIGFVGFVLVGSYPSIPAAFWRPKASDDAAVISDYYYADVYGQVDANLDGKLENVNDWVDLDGNGIFDATGVVNGVKVPLISQPEMFYGRIDAGGISSSITEQVNNVNTYFQKLHNFRLNRVNITKDKIKALGFYDETNYSPEENGSSPTYEHDLLYTAFPNMKIIEDAQVSSCAKLDEEMQNEYYFTRIISHGGDECLCVKPDYTLSYYLTKGADYFKSYYAHVFGCGTSRYLDAHYSNGSFGTIENIANMGEAFLFKNSRIVNITGVCASTWNNQDQQYFTELSKMSIGEAYRNYVTRHFNEGTSDINNCNWTNVPCYTLFGDPTLKHPLKALTNRVPVITNNLSKLTATAGQQFSVTLNISDYENDNVTVTFPKKPATAVYNATTKKITWTPTISNRTAGGTFSIAVTDTAGNVCTEEFNVSVK